MQDPQAPRLGGRRLPGVDAWRREHHPHNRQHSVGSQGPENPAPHLARRLEDEPPEEPAAHGAGQQQQPAAQGAGQEQHAQEADADEDLFTVEELSALLKEAKGIPVEVDVDNYFDMVTYLAEEPDSSCVGRGAVIQDYDVIEAWVANETNFAKPREEDIASLQPEPVVQIGFAAEAWKMLAEPLVKGNPGSERDVAVLCFYQH